MDFFYGTTITYDSEILDSRRAYMGIFRKRQGSVVGDNGYPFSSSIAQKLAYTYLFLEPFQPFTEVCGPLLFGVLFKTE